MDDESVDDRDKDMELREEFSADLRESLDAVARGNTTNSAEQVAQKLGLSWRGDTRRTLGKRPTASR